MHVPVKFEWITSQGFFIIENYISYYEKSRHAEIVLAVRKYCENL